MLGLLLTSYTLNDSDEGAGSGGGAWSGGMLIG
jgi:hypothetical protein